MKIGNKKLKINGKTLSTSLNIILEIEVESQPIFDMYLRDGYYYDATIFWGDGTSEYINYYDDDGIIEDEDSTGLSEYQYSCYSSTSTSTSTPEPPCNSYEKLSHTYSDDGIYHITIKGRFETLLFVNSPQLRNVLSWGKPEITKLALINFKNCNIKQLPKESGGLKYIETFLNAFESCILLESIPEYLFYGNTIATNFDWAFNNCNLIKTIPENLFRDNINATSFQHTFAGCEMIKSIPENLFSNNINVTDFGALFALCTSIESIPENLFSNNIHVTDFAHTFHSTTSVKGNVPELWNTHSSALGYYCFLDITELNIDNYGDIPSNWIGNS